MLLSPSAANADFCLVLCRPSMWKSTSHGLVLLNQPAASVPKVSDSSQSIPHAQIVTEVKRSMKMAGKQVPPVIRFS